MTVQLLALVNADLDDELQLIFHENSFPDVVVFNTKLICVF